MTKLFWIFLALIPLILGILILRCQTEPSIPIDIKTKIIYPTDTSKNFDNQILISNSALISLLQERESSQANLASSTEEGTRQIKTIYSAVLVVLITLLLSNKAKKNLIYGGLLVYIILSFYLDVSQEDMLNRQKLSNGITSNTLEYIINKVPIGRIKYNLNYELQIKQWANAGEPQLLRVYRKLWLVCHPSTDQFVYFIFPLLIIFSFIAYDLKTSNKLFKK